MVTKSQTESQAQMGPELFTDMQAKVVEAFSAFAQANQRVLQELVDFSASAAKEGVRAYAELQSAAVEAARTALPAESAQRPSLEDLQRDPFCWYQKGLLTTVDGTQKAFRFLEANAQVVTRSAERLQASAERTGNAIQEALTAYVSRMKEIYTRN